MMQRVIDISQKIIHTCNYIISAWRQIQYILMESVLSDQKLLQKGYSEICTRSNYLGYKYRPLN